MALPLPPVAVTVAHLLTAAALVATAVGTGCCLTCRAGAGLPGVAAMTVMLAGMLDVLALGCQLSSATGWAVVFLVLAAVVLLTRRGSPLGTLRSLHLAVTGILTPGMAGAHGPGMNGHGMEHGVPAGIWSTTTAVSVAFVIDVGYAAFPGRTVLGRCGTVMRRQLCTGAVSTAAMVAMAVS